MSEKDRVLRDSLLTVGDTSPLVAHLKRKQALLAASDSAHLAIRTVAIFEGGGMRGVFGSGVIDALEQLGMNEVFDNLVGISAGACNAAYLAAHQAAVGPAVFYDDLPKGGFISIRRWGNFMNMALLADIFRNQKALNQKALRASRSQLRIGMTDVEAAKSRYLT